MKAEVICILDRSGSMESIRMDSIGGFNTFLDEQKAIKGEASLTLVLFDDKYEIVHDNINIQDVPPLDATVFVPRGWTALLDAIGKTVTTVGERLAKTDEALRPDKVIVVILTDGYENQSTEYNSEQIKEMIKHQQEKYSWEFIYLGANQDAFAVGGSLGIKGCNTCSFDATPAGARSASRMYSSLSTGYRNG
jgi:uncharacterized protein YegL